MKIDVEELFRIHQIINEVDEEGLLYYSIQGLESLQDFVDWFSFRVGEKGGDIFQ